MTRAMFKHDLWGYAYLIPLFKIDLFERLLLEEDEDKFNLKFEKYKVKDGYEIYAKFEDG